MSVSSGRELQMRSVFLILLLVLLSSCTANPVRVDQSTPLLLSGPEMISIHFKQGRPAWGDEPLMSVIEDGYSGDALNRDLLIIKKYKHLRFEVLGFADREECSGAQCEELSLRRARSVFGWLVAHGVSKSALAEVAGHGADMPLDESGTKEGKAVNRRVEINIVP